MGRWPAAALAALLALTLAACDGGGDDEAGDNGDGVATAAPTTTTAAPGETPDTGTTPLPGASPTLPANPDDLATLEDVRDLFVGSTFTATYQNLGRTDVTFVPVRIYKDGQQRYRVDFVGEREGQPYSGVSIIDQGSAYTCGTGELAVLIGGDESGACVRDPGGTGNPIEALFSAFNADPNLRILERTERQIAGRTARCFTTEHVASGARGTVCQDATGGALLAIESADPADTNIVATEVTDAVSDADFVPPYELHELPAGE